MRNSSQLSTKRRDPRSPTQMISSQRSSQGFKKPQSPQPLTTDELAQSLVVSDVSKRHFLKESSDTLSRMSSSPKKSGLVRSNSSMITKKLTSNKNQHDKTVIKMLGLNLEAVCNKPTHEKNRILFICKDIRCSAPNRLGCAHCFLQEHPEHQRMNVQEFCSRLDTQINRFRSVVKDIQQVGPQQKSLLLKVQNEFRSFREETLDKLSKLEQSLMIQVEERITQHDSWVALSESVEYLNKKNLFTMNQEEQQQAVDFLNDKQISDLMRIKDNIYSHQSQLEQTISQAWEKYMSQFKRDFDSAFIDNADLIYPLPNRKDEAQRRVKQLENRRHRIEVEYMKNRLVLKEFDQIELENQLILKRQQEEQAIQQREQERKKREAEQRQKDLELKAKEEEKLQCIRRTFPYQLFTKGCKHVQQCNTIPVFSCCNRAYQCQICHGNTHPPAITLPSLRYCIKCLEIYWTQYATNQPVNCIKCLPK